MSFSWSMQIVCHGRGKDVAGSGAAQRAPRFAVFVSPSLGNAVIHLLISLRSSGFWRKLGFYFCVILIVNGLVTVGYYTMDHCYGTFMNENGKWKMVSDNYRHRHQLEIILNFPGGSPSLPLSPNSPRLCPRPRAPAASSLLCLHSHHARAERSFRGVAECDGN